VIICVLSDYVFMICHFGVLRQVAAIGSERSHLEGKEISSFTERARGTRRRWKNMKNVNGICRHKQRLRRRMNRTGVRLSIGSCSVLCTDLQLCNSFVSAMFLLAVCHFVCPLVRWAGSVVFWHS
jgi:deoxyinosine 3'endonuclease (endonuclease V)